MLCERARDKWLGILLSNMMVNRFSATCQFSSGNAFVLLDVYQRRIEKFQ